MVSKKQIHGEETNAGGSDSCKQHKKGCPSYDTRIIIIINEHQYNVKNKHEESDAPISYTDKGLKSSQANSIFYQFVAL